MNQNEKNLKKLEELVNIVDGGLTKEDFVTSFQGVVNFIKKIDKKIDTELGILKETLTKLGEKVREDASKNFLSLKKQLLDLIRSKLAEIYANHEERMRKMEKHAFSLKPGKDGAPGERGKDGSPDTPEMVRDKLEELVGDERLDARAIRGLENGVVERGITIFGGGTGLHLYVNGVKKGSIKTVNLVPGTGVTITHAVASGRNDITFDASGTALSKLAATGTVNGVNASFTFASKPTIIISDGASYQENKGWTWVALTLTATMTVPPTYDIYGL